MTDVVDIDYQQVITHATINGFKTALDILDHDDSTRKTTQHKKSRQRLRRELTILELKGIPHEDVLRKAVDPQRETSESFDWKAFRAEALAYFSDYVGMAVLFAAIAAAFFIAFGLMPPERGV